MPHEGLDSGTRVEVVVPLKGQEATLATGPSGKHLRIKRDIDGPTLVGVRAVRAQTYLNDRRTLLMTEALAAEAAARGPELLTYAVVVQPGCSVGDHYHHRREEWVVLVHGRAQVRLQDFRNGSPTQGLLNLLSLSERGVGLYVPTGVAHSILAVGDVAVLQVLAVGGYDPGDSVSAELLWKTTL